MFDPVTHVLGLLKETFGEPGDDATFRTYYNGDPDAVPLFNLPALIVDQTGDDTTSAAFGEDDVTAHIVVKVVMNKLDDYDGDLVKPDNTTARKIRDLIARIDPTTGTYAANTVKEVLRNALFEGEPLISNDLRVEYGVMPRPEAAGMAPITAEGHVIFDITQVRRTDA